jgi:hypothetical protein
VIERWFRRGEVVDLGVCVDCGFEGHSFMVVQGWKGWNPRRVSVVVVAVRVVAGK